MNHVKPICRMAVLPAPAETKTQDPCGGLTGLEFKKCEKKNMPIQR